MSDLGRILDAHTIRFERLMPAKAERVWDYLTDPTLLESWLLARSEFEPRLGGKIHWHWSASCNPEHRGDDADAHCVITRFEPPHILAYTWNESKDQSPAEDSEVTFELEPRGEETVLVLTHRRLRSNSLDGFGAGWHSHLELLLTRIRNVEPEPFWPMFDELKKEYVKLAKPLMA